MPRIVTRHNINLDSEEVASILFHMDASRAIAGDAICRFEMAFADYLGLKHTIVVNSGRAALFAILSNMDLEEGAEVIVPAYTFFTIPQVVEACGFKPVFAPCNPYHYAIEPSSLANVISDKTAAIIVEHPYGQPAQMQDIMRIANTHDIPVIEDPSQSIGASLDGRQAGSFGMAAAISLVHGKNLMTFGGGVIATNDDTLYSKILGHVLNSPKQKLADVKSLARTGLRNWLLSTKPGFSATLLAPFYALNLFNRKRLDAIFEEKQVPFSPESLKPLSNLQAALGLLQLERLEARNAIRRSHADSLMAGLREVDGIGLPETVPAAVGTWNAFPVRVSDGEDFQKHLLIKGIDTRSDYMSLFAYEESWKAKGDVVYLPNHPGLNNRDIAYMLQCIRKLFP